MRLRVVKCMQCGSPAQLRDGAASADCPSCGSPILLDQALAEERALARRFPNPTPLRIGMKARFGAKEYELIGRTVFSMMEEGETYYWQEFELLAPDGEVLYLEYEDGHYKLLEPFTPTSPIGPQEIAALHPGSSINLDGTRLLVTEIGQSTLCFVEGELTYAAKVGSQRGYLDAQGFPSAYSILWDEDEIGYYRGRPLAPRDIFVAFGLKQQMQALEAAERVRRSRNYLAVVCLVMGLIALTAWLATLTGGRLIAQDSVPISAATGEEGARFGPFTLDPKLRIYRLIVRANLSSTSSWAAGRLELADGRTLSETEGDFYDESGYDDEGYWHDSDLESRTDFIINSPGPYYVRLYTEPDNNAAASQMVGYELRGGVVYPTYLILYGIIMLALSLLLFLVANPKIVQTVKEMSEDD
jgi:hypothetical protein